MVPLVQDKIQALFALEKLAAFSIYLQADYIFLGYQDQSSEGLFFWYFLSNLVLMMIAFIDSFVFRSLFVYTVQDTKTIYVMSSLFLFFIKKKLFFKMKTRLIFQNEK